MLAAGDLRLDPAARTVRRGEAGVELTAREFALLEYFMRNPNRVLSRTQIAEHVWDMNFDSDTNVIDVAIRRLRAKIDDDFDAKLIVTVRGMGYVLEAPDDGAVHSG